MITSLFPEYTKYADCENVVYQCEEYNDTWCSDIVYIDRSTNRDGSSWWEIEILETKKASSYIGDINLEEKKAVP